MYSLYRAWFGGAEESGSSGYPRLDATGLAPPDTLVRVGNDGEYHFVAHKAVLAAHSGYLKALLAAMASADAASGATGSVSHESHAPMITSVTVPSTIGGEAFAPLLNYMYTGRLEVSLDNIYTVLLATHLLHMPGALEQCRAALLRLRAPPAVVPPVSTTTSSPSATQQQQQHSSNSSVLRPVPNRLLGPAFCWPQSAASHLYPPHLPPHLPPALQLPPAMSLLPGPIMHKTAVSYGTKERSLSPASTSSQQAAHQPRSTSVSPELVVASSASSTTEAPHSGTRGPSPSASSGRVSVSDSNPDNLQSQSQPPKSSSSATATRRRQSSSGGTRQRQNSRSGRSSSQAERSSSLSSNGGGGGGSGATSIQTPGVVYDVACCDGPVRFHRVLNENYAPAAVQTSATQPPPPHRVTIPQCNGRSNSSSSSISSNCRAVVEPAVNNPSNVIRENDENEQRQPSSLASNNNSENRSSGSYTCGYCRHTFKSQYCYRKHARRHLLPTDGENVVTERQLVQPQPPAAPAQQQQQQQQVPARPAAAAAQQPEVKKREVRLLDLNVQYYPCKICGSKFPSYYFVHKHRKLCHANVDDPPQSTSSQNNSRSASEEPQQPKATTTTTTTGGAATQLQQAASTSENAQQQQPA